MHRSGTSAVARGLAALGAYLGNDFLEAQPENPTGYWEDRGIVHLNERALATLLLKWDDVTPIDSRKFSGWTMWKLRRQAIGHLRRHFTGKPLWGFKDPRTLRLLPFWLTIMRRCKIEDAYLLVIRNPASVAASLYARQAMTADTAQRLWLAYMVPFLDRIAGKALAVVDYDLLVADPRGELDRIAQKLRLPRAATTAAIERFADEFLDERLRHTQFSMDQLDTSTDAARATRDAYVLLSQLATDRRAPNDSFWSAWGDVVSSFDKLWMTRHAGVEPETRV